MVDGIHIQSVKYVIGSNKAALKQAISSQFLPLSPLAPQHCVRSQLDTQHTDAMGPYHSHSLSKLGRSRMWSGKTEGERIRIRGVRTMMKGTRKGDQEKKGKEEKIETIEQSPPRNNSGSSTPTPLTVDHPGLVLYTPSRCRCHSGRCRNTATNCLLSWCSVRPLSLLLRHNHYDL